MSKFAAFVLSVALFTFPVHGQKQKIVVSGVAEKDLEELRKTVPEVSIVTANPANLASQVADADGLVGVANPSILRAAKKLKWVHTGGAGVENVISPELRDRPITLTNSKIILGPQIADHAMGLLLALTRELYNAIRGPQARMRQDQLPELQGKTAVIIGVGGIGMQIAQRAFGFGMKVIGVDPKDIPYSMMLTRVVPPDQLNSVLPEADVVFVAAPLTPETEGMIGPLQFELMKKNSYFIAVSRGKLYNTDALVKAIDSKHLAGAGLDVTNPEPLPPGHPLRQFPNVIITPHSAGFSDHLDERRDGLAIENIRRFAQGRPLLNVVDKQKGY